MTIRPMRAEKIKSLLKRQPFSPIRLRLTDGGHVEIRHPEQVLVTTRDIFIALAPNTTRAKRLATPSSGDDYADDWMVVDPIHVVAAEPVNGRQPGSTKRRK